MKIDTLLDYPTLLAHQNHPVNLALRLTADPNPGARPQPVALCLVVDRSGSMAGQPLARARDAAALAVRHLRPEDRLGLVAFDEVALTIFPLQPVAPAQRGRILDAIRRLQDGGSTNLTAGWMLGRDALREAPSGTRRRLLLLSDGKLNAGITAPDAVRQIVAAGLEKDAIRTSCLGFGDSYDQDLLVALAHATQGEFYDASSPESLPTIVGAELEGLQKIAVQNLRLRLRRLDFCDRLDPLGTDPAISLPDGRLELALGDLVADEQRVVCFALGVLPLPAIDGQPAFDLEGEELLALELLYDEIGTDGIASRTFTQTVRVRATQDPGAVRPNGEVIQWVAVQRAAAWSDRIAAHADRGDTRVALQLLEIALRETRALGDGPGVEDALRLLQAIEDRVATDTWSLRESKRAKYRAQSGRRMTSGSFWCLDEPAPSHLRKPKPPQPPPASPTEQSPTTPPLETPPQAPPPGGSETP
jgi:Ca-activated chloride channel family protein